MDKPTGGDAALRIDTTSAWRLLARWCEASERWWYDLPDRPDGPRLGCYGTGYNHWGVQSNFKYIAAMTTLATHPQAPPTARRQWALDRAVTAMRYALASHVSRAQAPAGAALTDGERWGLTWISALGIERVMHAMPSLEPHLTDADRAAWREVLLAEADWLLRHYVKGRRHGIVGEPWNDTGANVPESNIWNGCFLWRAADLFPDHPDADAWRDRAHRFLINGVSIAPDAHDARIVAGRPISDWFVGANFFDDYALDHHGYCNVGYMVICHSNAAMLHFDLKARNRQAPESLHHHQRDLWQVTRRLVFADGRLARVGGDSRVRYAYCQEFLVPTLLYAADCFDEPCAQALLNAQLRLMQHEADDNADGTFYGRRLAHLAEQSPYYYTRLESDRACALSQLIAYAPLVESAAPQCDVADPSCEASFSGGWRDQVHGDVVHRCRSRFASVSWRAHTATQAMCQPPGDGSLCDWHHNLSGRIRFAGDDDTIAGGHTTRRKTLHHHIHSLRGGFATVGRVLEGIDLQLKDGWHGGTGLAEHLLAFAALPDGHTLLGFQFARALEKRAFTLEVAGLGLKILNDLYNNRQRRLTVEHGSQQLTSPPDRDARIDLASRWANIDDRVGVIGLYGAHELTLRRSTTPAAGNSPLLRSMYVEQLDWLCRTTTQSVDPGEVILDVGWAVLSSADTAATRTFAQAHVERTIRLDNVGQTARGALVRGLDGRRYLIIANFGDDPLATTPATLQISQYAWAELPSTDPTTNLVVQPDQARIWQAAQ